jgi:hypothetical protein
MDANSLEKKGRYSNSIRILVQRYCGYTYWLMGCGVRCGGVDVGYHVTIDRQEQVSAKMIQTGTADTWPG